MSRVTIATSLVARQRKYIVLLLNTNVRPVRLIMSSSCMAVVGSWGLLTSFIHSEHRPTMRAIGNFSGFNVDLYLLTGSLVLVIIHSVANIRGKFALRILSGVGTRPSKGPGIPKPCAHVARSGAHF